jgi:hypothetical protein
MHASSKPIKIKTFIEQITETGGCAELYQTVFDNCPSGEWFTVNDIKVQTIKALGNLDGEVRHDNTSSNSRGYDLE